MTQKALGLMKAQWKTFAFIFMFGMSGLMLAASPADIGDEDKKKTKIAEPINLKKIQKQIVYPQEMKKDGMEGQVMVQIEVDDQGEILDKEVLWTTDERLNETVMEAVEDLKFKKASKEEVGFKRMVRIPFTFKYEEL